MTQAAPPMEALLAAVLDRPISNADRAATDQFHAYARDVAAEYDIDLADHRQAGAALFGASFAVLILLSAGIDPDDTTHAQHVGAHNAARYALAEAAAAVWPLDDEAQAP